jgi:Rrf2 family protein
MKLSKRTEYGLRAIVALARLDPNVYVQSKDLSRQEGLPNKFLEAILLTMRRGGFLESKVGAGGGYRLTRHPRDVSVGEVIRRLEGRLSVNDTTPNHETLPGPLAVRLINDKLTQAMDTVLNDITLAQLLEHISRASQQANSMYYI